MKKEEGAGAGGESNTITQLTLLPEKDNAQQGRSHRGGYARKGAPEDTFQCKRTISQEPVSLVSLKKKIKKI